jgi:uncharacterized protein with beta-barrel porin domain
VGQYQDAAFRGNFTQESTGNLMIPLGTKPLHFEGTASIDGALSVMGIANGYTARYRTEILIADEGVTGVFSSVSWPSSMTLNAQVGYDANTVWLDVVRAEMTLVASSLGLTTAALGSAERVEGAFDAIDQGLGDSVKPDADVLAGAAAIQQVTSAQEYERTLSSLSGELHDADGAMAMMAIEGSRRALESRLDDLHGNQAPTGAWSQQTGGKRGWSSYDVDATGWMLGLDQRHGNGVTFGAALAETNGNAWHSQRYDRERNRQVEGQLYASWNVDEGYLLGSAAFGHMQRWLQREIVLGGDEYRVSSDYAHRYGNVSLQGGRRYVFGATTITPYVGAQLLQLDRDAFSEQGASGFGLTSEATTMTASQALLGARMAHAWRGASIRWDLQARAEWQHLLSQSGQDVQARFTGLDAWAPIVGYGLDQDVGVLGLSLGADVGRDSRISFDVDSRYSNGEAWTGAQAKWSTGW